MFISRHCQLCVKKSVRGRGIELQWDSKQKLPKRVQLFKQRQWQLPFSKNGWTFFGFGGKSVPEFYLKSLS